MIKAIVDDDNIEVVKQIMMKEDFDVNTRDDTGRTPLILAVVQGREEIVDFLLANGANIHAVDKYGMSAIWSIIRTIYEGGFLQERLNNHINIIKVLGKKDNTIFKLQKSLTGNNSISILHYAIGLKLDRKVIKALISAGAPLDAKDSEGNTILVPALESLMMTKTLLELVDELVDDEIKKDQMIETKNNIINSKNNKGETPLLNLLNGSLIYIDEDKVNLLIEHGADVQEPAIGAAEQAFSFIKEDLEELQREKKEEEESYDSDEENEMEERFQIENERMESMSKIIKTLEKKYVKGLMENLPDLPVLPDLTLSKIEDFLLRKGGNKTKKRKKSNRKKSNRKKSNRKKTNRKKTNRKKTNRKKTNRKTTHRKKYKGRRTTKK